MINKTKVGEYKPTTTANKTKILNQYPLSFRVNHAPRTNGIGTSKQPTSNPNIRESLNSCRSVALRHDTKNNKPKPSSITKMLTTMDNVKCVSIAA